MAAYAVLRLDWTPEKANSLLLENIAARLAFFRDYHGDSSYKLNIMDCLRGLQIGCKVYKWFPSLASTKFPQATNAHLDMNWIVPNKFIAFKDPTLNRNKENCSVSKAVIKELKRCGIRIVVRLNGNDHCTNRDYYGNSYDPDEFKAENFHHIDIPFKDVGIPSVTQVKHFIKLSERPGIKLAVHCHAGLGRTATMIGCHLIKNYKFDSRSVCGWLKMCRRGSVMGPQHFFLDKFQKELGNFDKITETPKSVSVKQVEMRENATPMKIHSPTKRSIIKVEQPSQSLTRISRAPRKNNIIHIAPGNNSSVTRNNPMEKYKPNSGKGSKEKRHKAISPQHGLVVKPTPSPSIQHRSISKACTKSVVTKTSVTKSRDTTESIRPTKPRKYLSKSARPTVRPCFVNMTEINLDGLKKTRQASQTIPSARQTRSMSKRISKSHDTLKSRRPKSTGRSFVPGSNSCNQWSTEVNNSLVSHSKSRIYELINSVYSRNSLNKQTG